MEVLKKLRFFNFKLLIIIINIKINLKKKSTYFSIIVPCYNASKHIERCIKSIQKQTFKNFEVIFIDDCNASTDPDDLGSMPTIDPECICDDYL